MRVNDTEHPAPFRSLRRRDAPDDAFVARVLALREPAYVYFSIAPSPRGP